MPNVARVIVDQLVALGADLAFGVPGESYLSVLDVLHDQPELRFVTCRHEGGAAFAAEAHAKLTGRPGVLMVTRGPGVTNAAIGIHLAQQDETPMVVLVGQVPRHQRGRDAFQELDLVQVFGSMCTWVHELVEPERTADVIATAWQRATAGRPGPVVIGLPEDLLDVEVEGRLVAPSPSPAADVDPVTLARVRELVDAAERPLAIVGGSRWDDAAIEALPRALGDLPVVTGFRRQDLVDHRLGSFAGALGLGADPALVALAGECDLVLAIGDRLDDPTTNGFTLWPAPHVGRPLVHVHPDPRELGRVWQPSIAVATTPGAFVRALGDAQPATAARRAWIERCRAGYERWAATPGLLDDVVRGLRDLLADDAIVTNGAGNFSRPLHRAFPHRRPGRQLAPVGGTMGYGLPAAVAAKIVHPDRTVVCIAGDGDLLMTAQELATAALYEAPIVVLVVDNGEYGTIRTHQERRFPGRPVATALRNPDFVEFARSFGMQAVRTTDAASTLAALAEAVASGRPSLVHLTV